MEQTETGRGSAAASPLKAIRHLDYVILPCDEPKAMRAFYEDVLGFEPYRDLWDGAWVELRAGSVLLVLRARDMMRFGGRSADGSAVPADAAGVQLAFRVAPAGVDACHEALRAAGVPILDPPVDQPWGHRTLFFRDPGHNLLEIYADI